MTTKIQKATENSAVSGQKRGMTMQDYVKSMMPAISKALPSVITPERFSRITLSALSSNAQLQQTTPASFMGAMMTAAQLGLEPNTPLGQAYLIPYKNKGKLECQFQLGYKGLIDLAYRSGQIKTIQAHTVYADDEFEFEYGLTPKLRHVPSKEANKGAPIFFYAVFNTKDDGYGFEVMGVEDINAHAAKYSQSYNSNFSPWKKNFEEMAKKTVLKRVLKYAPLKTDFVRELNTDETVKSFDIEQPENDMLSMPNEVAYEIDTDTGEVLEDASGQVKVEAK